MTPRSPMTWRHAAQLGACRKAVVIYAGRRRCVARRAPGEPPTAEPGADAVPAARAAGRLDLHTRTVRIRTAYLERSTGEMLLGPPKSRAGRRVVGIPT